MAEREELGSNLSPLRQACIREQSQWLRLPKAKKGRLQRAAIATAPFKSPSASEMLSNPFGLYAHAFDCASNRVAGGRCDKGSVYASFHLIEQPMDAF